MALKELKMLLNGLNLDTNFYYKNCSTGFNEWNKIIKNIQVHHISQKFQTEGKFEIQGKEMTLKSTEKSRRKHF